MNDTVHKQQTKPIVFMSMMTLLIDGDGSHRHGSDGDGTIDGHVDGDDGWVMMVMLMMAMVMVMGIVMMRCGYSLILSANGLVFCLSSNDSVHFCSN